MEHQIVLCRNKEHFHSFPFLKLNEISFEVALKNQCLYNNKLI